MTNLRMGKQITTGVGLVKEFDTLIFKSDNLIITYKTK